MKSTAYFTRTILTYLERQAATDPMFAEAFAKPEKNIDDCVQYILHTVRQSGCNGFHDDEIFGMALHYFLEDHIETGNPVSNSHIVVNHVVELTAEEKEQARKDAIQRLQDETYNKMMQPRKRVAAKPTVEINNQLTLF